MRSWILWVGLMATALLVAAFGYGCGQTTAGTCADNATCVDDGGPPDATGADVNSEVAPHPDGGPGDDGTVAHPEAGGDDGGPGTCVQTDEPKDQPCLVDEAYGVFVSTTTGTLSGAGTRASPLKTIDAAISLAVPEGGATPKRVYVCTGTYDETITIAADRDKVKVFGGFTCASSTWTYTGALATIAPSTQGVPLTLTGLTSALFADLEIDAQSAPQTAPATGSGASSIAVVANGSMGIEFRRTKLVAGNGQPGANGVLTPYTAAMLPTAADLNGNAADGGSGWPSQRSHLSRWSHDDRRQGWQLRRKGNGDPGLPALGGGSGGTSAQCLAAVATGGAAGTGSGAAQNGNGAAAAGAFAGFTWQPGSGTAGADGAPGQGGGGGGAVDPGGGGGGGAGGCGGAGGGGGGGGGASAAVLSVVSSLTLTNATLVSATAGNGGIGVSGQPGQSQGGGGGLQAGSDGCSGGRGGAGGAGGAGGGGAGGVSAGILYKGSAPTIDMATTTNFAQGQGGTKGAGAVPGTNDGINGPTGIQVSGQ